MTTQKQQEFEKVEAEEFIEVYNKMVSNGDFKFYRFGNPPTEPDVIFKNNSHLLGIEVTELHQLDVEGKRIGKGSEFSYTTSKELVRDLERIFRKKGKAQYNVKFPIILLIINLHFALNHNDIAIHFNQIKESLSDNFQAIYLKTPQRSQISLQHGTIHPEYFLMLETGLTKFL